MATRYKFGDNEYPHSITLSVVNWIDIFTRECYKEIIINSLKYCIAEKGLVLHAWVIMSNHVHLILYSKEAQSQKQAVRADVSLAHLEHKNKEDLKS